VHAHKFCSCNNDVWRRLAAIERKNVEKPRKGKMGKGQPCLGGGGGGGEKIFYLFFVGSFALIGHQKNK